MKAKLTIRSSNAKLGPIPASMTDQSTCPPTCPLIGAGCYAETGRPWMHWNRVKESGVSWSEFCAQVQKLPKHTFWRHNVAGDLPGRDGYINPLALVALTSANRGKRGFTYTHYLPGVGPNAREIQRANSAGFTVNLSADSLQQADEYAELGIAPVVVTVPSHQLSHLKTPAGRTVASCPAVTVPGMTCAKCQVCAIPHRKAIIGFPAHGVRFRTIDIRLEK